MPNLPLYVRNDLTGVGFIPAPIEALSHDPKLNDQVTRQVLRLDFPALFTPELQQRSLIIAHDNPGVRAADEVTAA